MAELYSSAASFSTKSTNLDDIRRSATFHPSIWRDHFLSYNSDITQITSVENEQLETHKEKIKKLLAQTPRDSILKLKLIDSIQHLGVGYHFEREIDESLRQIHDNYGAQIGKDKDDLHVIALRFRLLRQQGYRVPCEVFNKFINKEGNFKESLVDDVEGMLSLFEASNYGVNGEEILDKALRFSSSHLESLIHQTSTTTSLWRRIKGTLEIPVSKTMIRLGAKKFISMYQEDESHNEDLLNFAKLDFNIVQKMHQKELNIITRWWEDLEFANKLHFARDRLVEGYFWMMGVYFEPHCNIARIFLTKITALTSILDDIYDVYGNLDDLRRFTIAIPSWDISSLDELPAYMKIWYEALLDVYDEMEDELTKRGQSYRVQYAKQEMVKLSRAYMEEAEWCYNNHIPTLDDYINVALVTTCHPMLATTSLVGMPNPFTKQDFDWITTQPPILRTSAILGRLMDDVAGNGTEQKITAIECCMNENGCSRIEALKEISKRVNKAWKDMNEEWLKPRPTSKLILNCILNLTRVLCVIYAGDDGYTNSTTRTKDNIKAMFVDSI